MQDQFAFPRHQPIQSKAPLARPRGRAKEDNQDSDQATITKLQLKFGDDQEATHERTACQESNNDWVFVGSSVHGRKHQTEYLKGS